MFFHRHRRNQNYGVYLLAYQLFSARYIPPVTLFAILLQVLIFLGYVPVLAPHKAELMCLLPSRILYRLEWSRMLASVFMHADDMHLYFNMVSLLWKGRRLEPLFGSYRFLLILATFTVATSGTMVGLSYLADEVLQFDGARFMNQCAIGFSGVLFALKVLHTTYFPYSDHNLFGWLPVPSQYACWAELLLLQLVTPNASFIGHLSGILVGLAYTMGPLKKFVDVLEDIFQLRFGIGLESQSRNRTRQTHSSGNWFTNWTYWDSGTNGRESSTGYRSRPYERRYQQRNYDEYTGGLSEEEQIWRATQRSLYNSDIPPYPDYQL